MAMPKQHRILIATDGSRPAQAALATAAKFPWPPSSRVSVVVSSFPWVPAESTQARAAFKKSFEAAAAAARRALARRWPESRAVVIDAPPVDAILAEAERFKASVIVLGWRGHGTFRRLLAGSVSRERRRARTVFCTRRARGGECSAPLRGRIRRLSQC